MKNKFIKMIQFLVFAMAFNLSSIEIADAAISVRTHDWRIVVNSVKDVVYYSDYNGKYGTGYVTVYVGL